MIDGDRAGSSYVDAGIFEVDLMQSQRYPRLRLGGGVGFSEFYFRCFFKDSGERTETDLIFFSLSCARARALTRSASTIS